MPYLTPQTIESEYGCIVLRLNVGLFRYIWGAISELEKVWNWEKDGDVTPQEMADIFKEINMSAGTDCSPVGSIVGFVDRLDDDRWLLCDGSQYNLADYPEIDAWLRPTSLLRVSATVFATPDLNQTFLMGATTTRQVAKIGGSNDYVLSESQLPPHTHTYTEPTSNVDIEGAGVPDILAAGQGLPAQTGSTGGGAPIDNRPQHFRPMFYMKVSTA